MSKVADVFHPRHKPIEFLPSSTEIHCCLPVLLSVLLSKIIEKMQGVGCFQGPANEEKEPQSLLVTTLSLFVYNSSLIAGTIAEDDYKDNDGVKDGMKFRDSLLGRQGVALSPLTCRELALLAHVDDTFQM